MTRAPTRPAPIEPVALRAASLVSAAGDGLGALAELVRSDRSALAPNTLRPAGEAEPLRCWTGEAAGLDSTVLPAELRHWDCRATRLAWRGLQADAMHEAVAGAIRRHGAARVGLVLATSAATIAVSEQAYRQLAGGGGFPAAVRRPELNTPHALALFVAAATGLEGPSVTVSTACSSSAKALAMAERWLRLGLADAVLVGGVDALCASVLYGFHALGLISAEPCRPFDARRDGISVGEAAGFVLVERGRDAPLLLCGYGEANDAHHMSAPHPQGLGAEAALDDALARAGLVDTAGIGFVSLHGTATPHNDAVEAALVARRYAADVHAAAGKGAIGHTMGAAGLAGAALAWLALGHGAGAEGGVLAGSPGHAEPDPALDPRFAAQLARSSRPGRVRLAASHAFGFGGNNVVLLFGRGG
jgi:3-oxoacyl-[acyl-carrier-protein] synthase-1